MSERDSSPQSPATTPGRGRQLFYGALIVLSLVGCVLVLSQGWITPRTLTTMARDAGWRGAFIFMGLVVVMELLWLPRMWAMAAAGLLFGGVRALMITMTADTVSALLCYAIGRGAGRDWVKRLAARRPRARRVMELLVERRGGATIAILRLVPVAHYTLVSYLAGLSGIRLRAYLIGNTLGLLPGAVLFATVGAAVLEPRSPLFLIGAVLLLAALVGSAILARRFLK